LRCVQHPLVAGEVAKIQFRCGRHEIPLVMPLKREAPAPGGAFGFE
jgi:hypothetical protein